MVSEIGVLNAGGRTRNKILEIVEPYFSRRGEDFKQMKKYRAAIYYLTQGNEGLKEKVNSEKNIQKQMEVFILKRKMHTPAVPPAHTPEGWAGAERTAAGPVGIFRIEKATRSGESRV